MTGAWSEAEAVREIQDLRARLVETVRDREDWRIRGARAEWQRVQAEERAGREQRNAEQLASRLAEVEGRAAGWKSAAENDRAHYLAAQARVRALEEVVFLHRCQDRAITPWCATHSLYHAADICAALSAAARNPEAATCVLGEMMDTPEFKEFAKIGRLSREIVVTEKIDGTNGVIYVGDDGTVLAGSRSRWIVPLADNFGFAEWVDKNAELLRAALGPGYHFGEWWGAGIGRRYGVPDKRFSLFNTSRWGEVRPACCLVVPVLYTGPFDTAAIERVLDKLRENGSVAAPGFMKPEGVVIYHRHSNTLFKKTLERDDEPKSLSAAPRNPEAASE